MRPLPCGGGPPAVFMGILLVLVMDGVPDLAIAEFDGACFFVSLVRESQQ